VLAAILLAGTSCAIEAETSPPVLETPCLEVGSDVELPENWLAADVSSGELCLFVFQHEGLADTTAIAGELFISSSGAPFEKHVADLEEGLRIGQEPDLLSLQRLNSGASGRDLPILERLDFDEPNRAVAFVHESDRRDGFIAISAVVEAPTRSDGVTQVLKMWGLLLPPSRGDYQNSPNYPLFADIIENLEFAVPAEDG
jgi:hypothetical protein